MVANKWAAWPHNPRRLGGCQRLGAGDKIIRGPQMNSLATLPLPSWGGARTLQSGGENHQ